MVVSVKTTCIRRVKAAFVPAMAGPYTSNAVSSATVPNATGDEIGRNILQYDSEDGFSGSQSLNTAGQDFTSPAAILAGSAAAGAGLAAWLKIRHQSKKIKALKELVKLSSVYSALPAVRLGDTLIGGGLGALGGAALNTAREYFTEDSKDRDLLGAATKGVLLGGATGAALGNVVGDRARRYLSNTVPLIGHGYSSEATSKGISPFKDDGGVDWSKLYSAAVDDVPVRRNSLGETSNKIDDFTERARHELFRRQLGVHTPGASDLWVENNDKSMSMNPDNVDVVKHTGAMMLPIQPVKSLSDWVSSINSAKPESPGAMRWITGGQTASLKPFPGPTVGAPGPAIIDQRDRWDFTMRPNEKEVMLGQLKDFILGDKDALSRPAEPGTDYEMAITPDKKQTRLDQMKSLLQRSLINNLVAKTNPWIQHRLVATPSGSGGYNVSPMTWGGVPIGPPLPLPIGK